MEKYQRTKYTREILEPLVRESISVAEVLKKLQRPLSGGGYYYINKKIKDLGIDRSHFLGQSSCAGIKHHRTNKIAWEDVLVYDKYDGRRTNALSLRRALIESGVIYTCSVCRLTDQWQGKEIRLHVDHINGKFIDNSPENLRFLCPNCHSQTSNFCMNKGKTSLMSSVGKYTKIELRKGKECNLHIQKIHKTKISWPPTEDILKMIKETSWTETGKQLGVSDNAVRKRVKKYPLS